MLTIVLLVLAAGAVSVVALVRALAPGDLVQERIQAYAALPEAPGRRGAGRRPPRLSKLRLRLNAMLSSIGSEKLGLMLTRANWRITVSEFLLLRFTASLAGLFLGWFLTRSFASGVALAVLAYLVPSVLMRWNIGRRQREFERQLVDVLVLINGAVRAGFSLLQAIEVVVKEMKPPASVEFGRVVQEVSLGLPLPQALSNLSARMQNSDLELVVTAVQIQYQVGGNLATMLTAVTETIRERIRLFGEVRVLTTQQRYTSYLLSVLPIFVGAMLFLMNPEYMQRLFDPGPIRCVPIGAALGIVLGHFTIRRIARLEV